MNAKVYEGQFSMFDIIQTNINNATKSHKSLKEALENRIGTVLHSLCSLPASDGNYESALKKATPEDLKEAYLLLRSFPTNNKSRISTIKRYAKQTFGEVFV